MIDRSKIVAIFVYDENGFFLYSKRELDKDNITEKNYTLTYPDQEQLVKPLIIDKTNINSEWTEGATEEEIIAYKKSITPESVSKLNFRLALIDKGISIADIDARIDLIEPQIEKEKAYTLWNFANIYERNNELLISVANQLGISDTELDDIFITAERL